MNIWLEAQGGAGAHSGCYDLLRFDGRQLHSEAAACSSSPGDSRLEDVNGDGVNDVVLDATDYYVFCYACGVRQINYTVMRWDGQKIVEVKLAPLPGPRSGEVYNLTNQAISLAQDCGLAPVFETARMYTGAIPPLRLERVFGVTSFELG